MEAETTSNNCLLFWACNNAVNLEVLDLPNSYQGFVSDIKGGSTIPMKISCQMESQSSFLCSRSRHMLGFSFSKLPWIQNLVQRPSLQILCC